jgi:hypothetical protein
MWDRLRGIRNWRGKALDAVVFVANYFMYEPLTRLLRRLGQGFTANDDRAARQLSWLLLATFAAYVAGALLKRAPLQARLGSAGHPDFAGCLILAWVAMHITLSILGFITILVGFNAGDPKMPQMCGLLIASLVPTAAVGYALKRPTKPLAGWRAHWLMELLADLLISSAVVVASIIWTQWMAGVFTANAASLDLGAKIFGAGLLALAFALFYLAPRFIYLAEDYRSRLTWLFIALAISPSVLRLFFGQLPLANWLDWFV